MINLVNFISKYKFICNVIYNFVNVPCKIKIEKHLKFYEGLFSLCLYFSKAILL